MNLVNEEALSNWGLLRQKKNVRQGFEYCDMQSQHEHILQCLSSDTLGHDHCHSRNICSLLPVSIFEKMLVCTGAVWTISSLIMMVQIKERVKSVSDSCPYAKATKDSGRKTKFKVTPGEGLMIVICFPLKCQMLTPDMKSQTGTSGILPLLPHLGNSFLSSCSTAAGPEFAGCCL